ncbi:MAG: alpha/beta hydrolase [Candidatus Accumulibacter sp.]|jgi:pimeloyl-ACP methyl ester carboxylesterase|nr:alpha/beta hydrolase [Accumulibacter sp.]
MPRQKSRTEKVDVRGLRYNVRHWGPEDAPAVFFLHGWMDCSPTFQFVVDALRKEWHVIAPDWRGYGESEWLNRPYWFPDYYADLDCLLAHYSPGRPARIVGHSMGANVAGTYAGVRRGRVSQLVMLDFLGLRPAIDEDSPKIFGQWLDCVARGVRAHFHPDCEALAARLMQANPRLTEERAAFLSWKASRMHGDGTVSMACDPWHHVASPMVYHVEDTLACWRRIEAPVLLLIAEHGYIVRRFANDPREFERRLSSIPNVATVSIPDSGHNVQHDQPERVAAAIEEFLDGD